MLAAALVLMLVFNGAFLLAYGLTRPWWRSWEGRALITSSTGWVLVSGGFLFDDYAADLPDGFWIGVGYLAVLAGALKVWMFAQARRDRP